MFARLGISLIIALVLVAANSSELLNTGDAALPEDQNNKALLTEVKGIKNKNTKKNKRSKTENEPNEAIKTSNTEVEWHDNIVATVFWVGEEASADNDFIDNISSAWMTDWVSAFGGVDDPDNRCGYFPCGFTPKENPFYFALPYADYDENGIRTNVSSVVPWYSSDLAERGILLKNRWIAIKSNSGKIAYAQWEDVGPFEYDDHEYVFGTAPPKAPKAGLDLSPATADYLGINGRGLVSWAFISDKKVPKGPWKSIAKNGKLLITTSVPKWN